MMTTQAPPPSPPQGFGVLQPLFTACYQLWSFVVGTPWYDLPLQNSWVNYGGAYSVAQYRKAHGVVELQGLIKDGTTTNGTIIGSLPEGFRPNGELIFTQLFSGGGSCWARIKPGGDIDIYYVTSNAWLSLCGITFKAEQ